MLAQRGPGVSRISLLDVSSSITARASARNATLETSANSSACRTGKIPAKLARDRYVPHACRSYTRRFRTVRGEGGRDHDWSRNPCRVCYASWPRRPSPHSATCAVTSCSFEQPCVLRVSRALICWPSSLPDWLNRAGWYTPCWRLRSATIDSIRRR